MEKEKPAGLMKHRIHGVSVIERSYVFKGCVASTLYRIMTTPPYSASIPRNRSFVSGTPLIHFLPLPSNTGKTKAWTSSTSPIPMAEEAMPAPPIRHVPHAS